MMVSQSYSKNLGLYAERIGALNVILASQVSYYIDVCVCVYVQLRLQMKHL